MTETVSSSRPIHLTVREWLAGNRNKLVVAIGASAYAYMLNFVLKASDAQVRFHFDPTAFMDAGLAIKLHVIGALLSFGIGCVLMLGVKGGQRHRQLGYSWVAAMLLTALSSFFVNGFSGGGGFSWIHGLSAWVVIALPMGVAAARRRNFKAHRKHMTNMFVGAMLVAGLFTFFPGRMMWEIFFAA